MKKIHIFLIILIVSCSKSNDPTANANANKCRLTKISLPQYNPSSSSFSDTAYYAFNYDVAGGLTSLVINYSKTQPLVTFVISLDANQRIVQSRLLGSSGYLTSSGSFLYTKATFVYDSKGNLTESLLFNSQFPYNNGNNVKYEFTYNSAGQLVLRDYYVFNPAIDSFSLYGTTTFQYSDSSTNPTTASSNGNSIDYQYSNITAPNPLVVYVLLSSCGGGFGFFLTKNIVSLTTTDGISVPSTTNYSYIVDKTNNVITKLTIAQGSTTYSLGFTYDCK